MPPHCRADAHKLCDHCDTTVTIPVRTGERQALSALLAMMHTDIRLRAQSMPASALPSHMYTCVCLCCPAPSRVRRALLCVTVWWLGLLIVRVVLCVLLTGVIKAVGAMPWTCDKCGIRCQSDTTNTNMCAVSVSRCFSGFGNDPNDARQPMCAPQLSARSPYCMGCISHLTHALLQAHVWRISQV